MGGSVAVGAVSGSAPQTDRLHTIGMMNDPDHVGDSRSLSGSPSVDQPRGPTKTFSSETPDQIALEAVTTQTAPGSAFEDVQTAADLSELATETETVAAEDVLILEITSAGLTDALASESDIDLNARLLELVRSGVLEVQITNRASNTTLDLSATNETGGVRVLPDAGSSTVYILIDTEQTVFADNTTGVTAGDLNVEIDSQGTSSPVSERVTVTPREASFETDGDDRINLTADSNRTITGDTSVAPNTNLTVQIQSNEEATFNITRTAQVSDNRQFSFRVDFDNVTKGTEFVMLIPDEGFSEAAATEGILTAGSSASVRLTGQQFETDRQQKITVRSANLSEGGFLAVYNQSYLTQNRSEAQEGFLGASGYLQAGSHQNTTIQLNRTYQGDGTLIVVPRLDTNDNMVYDDHNASIDKAYQGADGGAVIAVANASPGTDSGGHSPASQQTESSAVSDESTDGSVNNNDDHPEPSAGTVSLKDGTERNTNRTDGNGTPNAQLSEVDGPGFGPLAGLIAVGITALITALIAALARRP